MPKITRLPEVVDYIKGTYGRQLRQTVRIWPDSGLVDRSKIAPHEAVVQVTYVTPFFDGSTDGLDRSSFIGRHTNLTHFMFSTPFTAGVGSLHATDVTKQQKRNTILRVAEPFPSLTTRQLVAGVEQRILSPVESSTENVASRIVKLREAIQDKSSADKKVLTSLLQGSVMLQVHGGTKEIALAFFGEGSDFAQAPHTEQELAELDVLRQTIVDFIDVCEQGIDFYHNLIVDEEAALAKQSSSPASAASSSASTSAAADINNDRILHTEFDKHLRKLRAEIMPVLKVNKKPNGSKQRGVRFHGAPDPE